MHVNKELELAFDFIEKTDRNVFLTGKAGTGKTTFLHRLKSTTLKRMVVVAPTGVAAINAKGVTIHSFFQMPFGPIIPGQTRDKQAQQRKFNKKKIDIIRSLDLVVIDEISMVRADLLDGIDQVLRRYKDRNKVFGGAQILMIGDLQQLSPVVRPNEWELLKPYYETIYFFSSKSFMAANAVSIELRHIYRQDNQEFIAILNEIRNNNLSETSAVILNERFNPDFEPKKEEGYITLTTHNNRADTMNNTALAKLKTATRKFKASINGDFREHAYPTAELLTLKEGAQVMFIKNDSSPEKRYFNGKIGVITYMDSDTVTVQCANESEPIDAGLEKWENITYTLDETTKEISENVIGEFSQIPLRLAWAITIHKSQGLTFDKAIIDAEASFAHGQTYVALSRCKTLEGIVLKSKIGASSIISDVTVKTFTQDIAENLPDDQDLCDSEKAYELNLIAELFDYYPLLYPIKRLLDIYFTNKSSFQGELLVLLEAIKDDGVTHLLKVSAGFKRELLRLHDGPSSDEGEKLVKERFVKAIDYFINQTKLNIEVPLSKLNFSIENAAVKTDFNKQLQQLEHLLAIKKTCLNAMVAGFERDKYIATRVKAVLETPRKARVARVVVDNTKHPQLMISLKLLRTKLSNEEDVPPFQIFTQKSLFEMCDVLPVTPEQLLKVNGMGKIRVKKYGSAIIDIINSYCANNELSTATEVQPQLELEPQKTDTKKLSLNMFKDGMSVKDIAKKRELVELTISGHLAHYIPTGEVDVLDLITKHRYEKLKKLILKTEYETLSDLKNKLGGGYEYGELRLVLGNMS
ncbi:MAG: helicase [Flavobacteriaceae bacterium]|nr:MAG: helicase [Flavobacteriaceae bacterium]